MVCFFCLFYTNHLWIFWVFVYLHRENRVPMGELKGGKMDPVISRGFYWFSYGFWTKTNGFPLVEALPSGKQTVCY